MTASERKLPFLIVFAVIYGLVFINYIDIISPGGSESGYHLWLTLMYFLPFIGLSISNLKNWKLTVALGLIASLMNDVFYLLIMYFMGFHVNLFSKYSLWLIPQNTVLFNLNLGFAVIPVASWMMAFSIYARIAITFVMLKRWNIPLTNLKIPLHSAINKQPFKKIETSILFSLLFNYSNEPPTFLVFAKHSIKIYQL